MGISQNKSDKKIVKFRSFQFKRLKNKTLSLLFTIYPEDLEILEQIKYKKLIQSISKEIISKNRLEARILDHNMNDDDLSKIHLDEYYYNPANRPSNNLIKFNNSWIISIKEDSLNLWDLKSGELLRKIRLDIIIYSIIIKLNNKQIIIGYSDKIKYSQKISNYIVIFDLQICKSINEILYIENGFLISIIKLNKSQIICGGSDNSIIFMDLPTTTCLKSIKADHNFNSLLKINSSHIISGGNDNNIKVWELPSGKCLFTLKNSHVVNSIEKLSRSRIASLSNTHCIKIWDIISGTCIKKIYINDKYITRLITYKSILAYGLEKVNRFYRDDFGCLVMIDKIIIKMLDFKTGKHLIDFTHDKDKINSFLKINETNFTNFNQNNEAISIWNLN